MIHIRLIIATLFLWYVSFAQGGSLRGRGPGIQEDWSGQVLPIPKQCFLDPELPECQNLLHALDIPTVTLQQSSDTAPAMTPSVQQHRKYEPEAKNRPPSYLEEFNYDPNQMASNAPTQDMCYGNMSKLPYKKFCNSEMPSVSLEPSEQPVGHPPTANAGGDDDDEGGTRNVTFPEDFPDSNETMIIPSPLPTAAPARIETFQPASPPTSSPSHRHTYIPTPTFSPIPTVELTTVNFTDSNETLTPTLRPTTLPTQVPTITSQPSSAPTYRLGMCQGDCDSPTDCAEGLYCYHRDSYEAVPGCPQAAGDASRTDYCTDGNDVATRLKLYWDESYWWQDSNTEARWCMVCADECQIGDSLMIHECAWNSEYFRFAWDGDAFRIQVYDTDLCLERDGTSVTLQTCDFTEPLQEWTSPMGNATEGLQFEIAQGNMCMTTHHHPKHGEIVELYKCRVARKDTTSFWTMY
eukprot:Nitzschia sp. Nitz4//scaffold356_size15932//8909//10303//NITZ4_008880-RA/size15932-processed-gene-0.10-mRNA-1//1//CDS//3329548967//3432//frame0